MHSSATDPDDPATPGYNPDAPFDFEESAPPDTAAPTGSADDPPLHFLHGLNSAQRRAVSAGDGPLLVVAGAGTGKTRVIVYRVAFLVSQGLDPSSILLLTFTRRAADEMLRRASLLLDHSVDGVAGGTFHSFANALLRRHGSALGIAPNFTILDAADAADTLGHLRSALQLSGRQRRFPQKRTCLAMISAASNRDAELADVIQDRWPHLAEHTPDLLRLHLAYRDYKIEHGLLDYDDLLLYARELLASDAGLCTAVAESFAYILVDEYQDTNRIQGDLVRLLGRQHGNVMVVGDDAQSIYRFRGATVENILDFPRQFPSAQRITLERNYRSTQEILDLANAVLEAAPNAYPKILFAPGAQGPRPRFIACDSENIQSKLIVNRILELTEQEGVPLTSIAVLFRSSFHSFDLELELKRREITYVKHGGFKFMETAHVKDLVTHLKVVDNLHDEPAWMRVLTLLPGIGDATGRRIFLRLDPAAPFDFSWFRGAARVKSALARLGPALQAISRETEAPALAVQAALEYLRPIMREHYEDYPKRLTDLEHVVVLAAKHNTLRSMLDEFAIEPPNRSLEEGELAPASAEEEERLVLSTIHSAKGLEWDAVFVLWNLDGRFPAFRVLEDREELEEERRLIYVAITRARQELTLTYPVGIWDRSGNYLVTPSIFLRSLPADLLEPWHAGASGLGLDGRIRLEPMVTPPRAAKSINDYAADDWEGEEWGEPDLRRRRRQVDRRILGDLSDDDWTYEVDEDCDS
jgi:DNA helicase-2/ATP-dependent DNA helicase PcrA